MPRSAVLPDFRGRAVFARQVAEARFRFAQVPAGPNAWLTPG